MEHILHLLFKCHSAFLAKSIWKVWVWCFIRKKKKRNTQHNLLIKFLRTFLCFGVFFLVKIKVPFIQGVRNKNVELYVKNGEEGNTKVLQNVRSQYMHRKIRYLWQWKAKLETFFPVLSAWRNCPIINQLLVISSSGLKGDQSALPQ